MLVQGRWLQPQHLCRWLILVPCSLPLKAKDVGHYLLVAASLACGPSAPPSLPTCLPSRHVHAQCRERKRRRTDDQGEGSSGLLAMGMDVEEPAPARTADVYGSRDFGRGGDYG